MKPLKILAVIASIAILITTLSAWNLSAWKNGFWGPRKVMSVISDSLENYLSDTVPDTSVSPRYDFDSVYVYWSGGNGDTLILYMLSDTFRFALASPKVFIKMGDGFVMDTFNTGKFLNMLEFQDTLYGVDASGDTVYLWVDNSSDTTYLWVKDGDPLRIGTTDLILGANVDVIGELYIYDDSLLLTGGTGADSIIVWDSGDTAFIKHDNPMVFLSTVNDIVIQTDGKTIFGVGAFHVNTDADSTLPTIHWVRQTIGDTANILRAEMGDSARVAAGDTATQLRSEMPDSAIRVLNDSLVNFLRSDRDDTTTNKLFISGFVIPAGDSGLFRDPTDADTGYIYDDGDTFRIYGDNPVKIGTASLIIPNTGAVVGTSIDVISKLVVGSAFIEDSTDADSIMLSNKGVRSAIGDTAAQLRTEMPDSARGVVHDTADVLRAEMPDSALAAVGRGIIFAGKAGGKFFDSDTLPADSGLVTLNSLNQVTDDTTNWNTAYGWGDHSTAGYLTQNMDTIHVDTLRLNSKVRIVESAAGNAAIEHIDGTSPLLAIGNTTQTGASGISIVDGSTNEPGYLSMFTEAGSGMYSWYDADDIYRVYNNTYGVDPEAVGYRLIDADNGNTYSTDLHSIYRNDADTITGMLKVEQDGTGDAQVNMFLTGGQYYNLRLDNSDNDNFKIAINDGPDATADTTVFEIVNSASVKGVINMPYQIDARLYASDSTSIDTSQATPVKVALKRTSYFTNCTPDTTVNYRITVAEAGKYFVTGAVSIITYDAARYTPSVQAMIYYNGALHSWGSVGETQVRDIVTSNVSDVINMAAAGYVELYATTAGRDGTTFKTIPNAAKTYLTLVKVK